MNQTYWVHSIINQLDPALTEQAAMPAKKRLGRTARSVLLAACLCMALVAGAFAAEAVAGIIRQYYSGNQFVTVIQQIDPTYQSNDEDLYSGYVIAREYTGIDLDGVSEEVLAFSEACMLKQERAQLRFDSAQEMQAYLNLDLYDNAVLEQLAHDAYLVHPDLFVYDGENLVEWAPEQNSGAYAYFSSDELGLTYVEMVEYYGLNNGEVCITVTSEAIRSGRQEGDISYVYPNGTLFSEEVFHFTTSEVATLLLCEVPAQNGSASYTEYAAHFYAGGVRYYVSLLCSQPQDVYAELLTEILNAFLFK